MLKYASQTQVARQHWSDETSLFELRFFIIALSASFEASDVHTERGQTPKALNDFTIHGLWPKKYRGKDPKCKSQEQFNITVLQGLRSDLLRLWPSLSNYSSPETFWKHEFDKHGKCALQDPLIHDQYNYFKFGIDLMKKLNLLEALKNHGITPNASKQYNKTAFQKVFESELGHNGSIKCINASGQSSVNLLEEVRLCLNLTHQYTDCPPIGKCPEKFTFPPFES
ncbi:unnamed protein product [Schistosoma margrebowiei]|uniref:Uncharacterized protein n=1 Tax=Schistosoma margrebowiei TaxID=48269 RepID=A0A183N183_9TREM|nr:unnamed protein product [Schistosoma margrebowiei]